MINLQGQTAIVTGGANGIGKAIANRLTEAGAVVISFDVHADSTDPLQKKVNVANEEEIEQAVKEVKEEHENIHILVNNAGIFRDKRLIQMSGEEWDQVLNVNLKGSFSMMKHVAPHMLENEYGRIINISSVSHLGNFGQANYSASKAGIVSMSNTAALELAPSINVNAVAPGPIDTPLFQSMDDKGKQKLTKKVPLGKVGQPENIADAVLFFASDLASYVTGTLLPVDGGLTSGLNLR
ncbi:SDR family NAD(P)-dependent oxidoreductase [Bacillus tianshenii]|nr:SDR family NAD(P)-dependent oxidoreductase [Bacillus tianshenii]